MRLAFALCVPLLFAASNASAGLDLTWDGCAAGGALNTVSFTCNDLAYQARLVGSFNLPADVDSFYEVDVTLDLYGETGNIPDFWNFTAISGCNADGLTRQLARPTGCETTTNPWGLSGANGNSTFSYVTPFRGDPKRARIVMNLFLPDPSTLDLTAGTEYFAFSFLISAAHATEAGGSCPGCGNAIAIVWNSATFLSETRPDYTLSEAGPSGLCARANGAMTSSCDAVPVQRRTWGTLKSLYR